MRSGAGAEEDVERGTGGRDTSCHLQETKGTEMSQIKSESARGPIHEIFNLFDIFTLN